MDEESVLEGKTQFKYQTIVAKDRPNAEGEIVCEDGPCFGSWVVFPPQIGQIHKRQLLEVTQKNIIENITLAVSFIVNANLTVIPLKAGFQVFLSISVISSPSSSRLWISSIDSDRRSSDLPPAVPQGLHHHHLLGKVTIDCWCAKEIEKDEDERELENETGSFYTNSVHVYSCLSRHLTPHCLSGGPRFKKSSSSN